MQIAVLVRKIIRSKMVCVLFHAVEILSMSRAS